MLLSDNIKMALASLRASRWRSVLTMLGIIVGVASVVTVVSIGEGVRQQIAGQINHLGSDLITIRPGKLVNRSANGTITSVNVLTALGSSSLSEQDLDVIKATTNVKLAVPFSRVSASVKVDDREFNDGFIVGTTDGAPEVLSQKVQFGAFFGPDDLSKHIVVIGPRVAQKFFQENVPVGKSLDIRGEHFVVGGIFEQFDTSPLTPNADYNDAIFVPYDSAKALLSGQTQIYQVLVKPNQTVQTDMVIANLTHNLYEAHGQQTDFTILKQAESLTVANRIVTLLTSLIAGMATISFVVGGIGIMNIMLVSVIERTREIGIRKAVGATNRQILNQFVTEAAVISFAGGIIGLLLSLLAIYFIDVFTPIQPTITVPIMVVAMAVAIAIGMFFGIVPAVKAASKDPIDALRYE
ncbi:ABC transporter permease [Candidatus Saccharibacteria bacterium]|nr:ABC transporter permease [Candidatus Saccharibacteria bacterium]